MAKAEELSELIANIPGATLAGRVRKLMPLIDRRIREEGVRHEHIVAVLNEHGGFEKTLTLAHFRWILADYRRRCRGPGGRAGTSAEPPTPPESAPALSAGGLGLSGVESPTFADGIRSKADLKRVRSMRVDLEALAKQAREDER